MIQCYGDIVGSVIWVHSTNVGLLVCPKKGPQATYWGRKYYFHWLREYELKNCFLLPAVGEQNVN